MEHIQCISLAQRGRQLPLVSRSRSSSQQWSRRPCSCAIQASAQPINLAVSRRELLQCGMASLALHLVQPEASEAALAQFPASELKNRYILVGWSLCTSCWVGWSFTSQSKSRTLQVATTTTHGWCLGVGYSSWGLFRDIPTLWASAALKPLSNDSPSSSVL